MPYKKVFAFGDSFTRGDELADCPTQSVDNSWSHSNQTWPAIIANILGIEYDCRSCGGRGNQWISNQVNRFIDFKNNCLFIVNWTYFGRFDFLDHEDKWSTICPGSANTRLERDYYKNFDNDIWNLNRNLQIIHSVLCLLKENKIDFIFTCQDSAVKDTIDTLRCKNISSNHNHWQRSISTLSKPVVSNLTEFDNNTFTEWSISNGFKLGPHGHPLEKAHAEAAKYINTNVIEGMTNEH